MLIIFTCSRLFDDKKSRTGFKSNSVIIKRSERAVELFIQNLVSPELKRSFFSVEACPRGVPVQCEKLRGYVFISMRGRGNEKENGATTGAGN